MIPYGRQDITEQDIDSVISTLKSDLITQGNAVPAFEKKISDYVGVSNLWLVIVPRAHCIYHVWLLE